MISNTTEAKSTISLEDFQQELTEFSKKFYWIKYNKNYFFGYFWFSKENVLILSIIFLNLFK